MVTIIFVLKNLRTLGLKVTEKQQRLIAILLLFLRAESNFTDTHFSCRDPLSTKASCAASNVNTKRRFAFQASQSGIFLKSFKVSFFVLLLL